MEERSEQNERIISWWEDHYHIDVLHNEIDGYTIWDMTVKIGQAPVFREAVLDAMKQSSPIKKQEEQEEQEPISLIDQLQDLTIQMDKFGKRLDRLEFYSPDTRMGA